MNSTVAGLAATVAVSLFTLSWVLLNESFWAREQMHDTPLYEGYGDAIATGKVPYRDFPLEYPPAALPAFAVPSLIVGADAPTLDYHRTFEWTMLVCGVVTVMLMAGLLVGIGVPPARLVLALAFAALAPLALGSVVLSRFDLWPAVLTVMVLVALLGAADRLAAGLLAVAVAAKLYPVVLVPLVAAWIWRRRGRHDALVAAAVFGAVLAAVVLPFLLVAPEGFGESFWRQLRRPLQIESLGAATLVALHHLAGVDVEVQTSAGSQNIAGARAAAVGAVHTALQLAVLAWLWLRFARGPAEPERLIRYAAAAVLAFVALGRVLSPQFLIWLIPLVPLVGGRRGLVASALLGAALVLTQLWFPFRYWDYAGSLDANVTAFVVARGLVLVAALAVLAWPETTGRAPSDASRRLL